MYATVLFLHSWLRWIVVASGLFVMVSALRARASRRVFTRADDRFGLLFVTALDLQVALGLTMYFFLSPMTRAAFQNPGVAMHSSVLRFFLIEHAVSMVLALVAAHVGRIRTHRATTGLDKHQRAASGAMIACLCILVGIPWPFLPYARPLARLPGSAETIESFRSVSAQTSARPLARLPRSAETIESFRSVSTHTKEIFATRCGPCHGSTGHGDGPAAVSLLPRPRDFHDPLWQGKVTDQDIENIIRRGGLGVGKSMLMPSNPDFDDDRIRDLRLLVRSLGD